MYRIIKAARWKLIALLAQALLPAGGEVRAQANPWGTEQNGSNVGNHAAVNRINLYYEIHGAGKPLILLHGGLGAIEMFGPNLPALARGRRVMAVDLQGHGRTADIERPADVELMAGDIAGLIRHLKLERPDVMGYSMGGGVALQLAIQPRAGGPAGAGLDRVPPKRILRRYSAAAGAGDCRRG